MTLNVAIMGGRSFAVAAAQEIRERGAYIACVITNEDDPLEEYAHKLGVPAFMSPPPVVEIARHSVHLIVCAHNHEYVSRGLRAATTYGAIGYHPSLLPLHRGKDAVRWTVHMREPVAGGTVYWMDDIADGGPILTQDWCFVRAEDDASQLWRRDLFPMGVRMLAASVELIGAHHQQGLGMNSLKRAQDTELATWEPSWERPPLRSVEGER